MSQPPKGRDQREFPKRRGQRRSRCSICDSLTYSTMLRWNDGHANGLRCYKCEDKFYPEKIEV